MALTSRSIRQRLKNRSGSANACALRGSKHSCSDGSLHAEPRSSPEAYSSPEPVVKLFWLCVSECASSKAA